MRVFCRKGVTLLTKVLSSVAVAAFLLSIIRVFLVTPLCYKLLEDADIHCTVRQDKQEDSPVKYLKSHLRQGDAAERYLDSLNGHQLQKYYAQPNQVCDLSVVFVASPRQYPRGFVLKYLTQAVARFTAVLLASNQTNLMVSPAICDGQADQQASPEFTSEVYFLSRLLPIIRRTELPSDRAQYSYADVNILDKERADYALCLAESQRLRNCRYTILIEDDVLVEQDFLTKIKSILNHLSWMDRPRNIGFIKLYHPKWLRSMPGRIQLPVFGIGFGLVTSCAISQLLWYSQWLTGQIKLHNFDWLLIFLILASLPIFVGHWLGTEAIYYLRQLISSSDSVYLISSESCCTQAVLYPTQSVPRIVSGMQKFGSAYQGHAKDHILDSLVSSLNFGYGLEGLMLDHNIVRHVGRYTTLRKEPVNLKVLDNP